MSSALLSDLRARGLIFQIAGEDTLADWLDTEPRTLYCGFDPTADSLHIGSLVPLLMLRRFQLAGHRPLALVGGATGLIGDPSFKAAERNLNTPDVVANWVDKLRQQVSRFIDFEGENSAKVVNNLDWTADMDVLTFLRDVGKYFSINNMIQKESVKQRIEREGSGISFTEFTYMILQSYDFSELYRQHGCGLQIGGSDQWGNITAGVDLVRRVEAKGVHALTTPLLTRADGKKFGKTESGTIWLDPGLTSPYSFFQYWINADDRDIANLLKTFSFKSELEINELVQATIERPQERAGQRALASELTELVHGAAERVGAEDAGKALFGVGNLADLPESTLHAALTEASLGEVNKSEVVDGKLPMLDELLVRCGLAPSKKAARRTIAEGGAYVNNIRVDQEDFQVPVRELLYGQWVVLRRGRKAFAGVVVK